MDIKGILNLFMNELVLKPFGLQLRYLSGRDPVEDIIALLHAREVRTIIDGGAYRGTFSKAMARAFPQANIHAFEPTPASHDLLAVTARDLSNVELHRLALGAKKGTQTFYTNDSPLTNSLRRSSDLGHHHFKGLVAGEIELEVQVTALSDFAEEYGILRFDVVKLDLQGNELDALLGMGKLACTIQAILLEVQFVPLYENAPLFVDIESFLREKGLVLYQFYEMVRSSDDGRLLYGDALFVQPDLLAASAVKAAG